MPPKKQARKYRKPRSGNPNNKNSGSSLVTGTKNAVSSMSRVSESTMVFSPVRVRRRLRYHDNVSLVISGGAVSSYVFSANSLFDPNTTGTGHQPMGYDQAMLFHNHYLVEKARCIVRALNTAAGAVTFCLKADGSSTPVTTVDNIIEFGGVTFDTLEAKATYGSAKVFNEEVSIPRWEGIPRKVFMASDSLRGQATTSPVEQVYFHLQGWDPNGISGTVNLDVTLDYLAWFLEPRDATASLAAFKQLSLSGRFSMSRELPLIRPNLPDVENKDEWTITHPVQPDHDIAQAFVCMNPGCRYYRTNTPHQVCASTEQIARINFEHCGSAVLPGSRAFKGS